MTKADEKGGNSGHAYVGFLFITQAYTNIRGYVFTTCVEKAMSVIEKAAEKT